MNFKICFSFYLIVVLKCNLSAVELTMAESGLKNTLNNIKQGTLILRQIVSNTITHSQSLASFPSLVIDIIEQSILKETQTIVSYLNSSTLKNYSLDCVNFDSSQTSFLHELKAKTNALKQVTEQTGCQRDASLHQTSLLLSITVENLNKELNICSPLNIPSTPVLPNILTENNNSKPNINLPFTSNSEVDLAINVPKKTILPSNEANWIYGLSTAQEFSQENIKFDKDKATFCPLQTPFANNKNKCVVCSNIFDYSKKDCVSCPQGTTVSLAIHQCVYSDGSTFLKNSYSSTQIPVQGLKQKIYPNLSTCSSLTPFFNGIQCITCSSDQIFDTATTKCIPSPCLDKSIFDSATQRCKSSMEYKNNPNALNFIGNPPMYSQNSVVCPIDFPFPVHNSCSSCALPLYFDYGSMSCLPCATLNTIFDPKTKSCVPDSTKFAYYSNTKALNYIGTPLLNRDNTKIMEECPLLTPFYNNKYCIKCSEFFNFDSLSCESCAGETVLLNNKCVLPSTVGNSVMNSYTVNVTNFIGKVPQIKDSQSTCPLFSPFFDGRKCVPCNLPFYFNFKQNTCAKCAEKTIFSIQNRKCVYLVESQVTNFESANIFYNGDFADVNKKISKELENGAIVCSIDIPFYDATTDSCINCPSNLPYFNFRYNECMNCGEGTFFYATEHVCLASTSIDPTVQRTLMNIFNFDFFF